MSGSPRFAIKTVMFEEGPHKVFLKLATLERIPASSPRQALRLFVHRHRWVEHVTFETEYTPYGPLPFVEHAHHRYYAELIGVPTIDGDITDHLTQSIIRASRMAASEADRTGGGARKNRQHH